MIPGFFTTVFTDLVWSHPQKESTIILQDLISDLLPLLLALEFSKDNDGHLVRQAQDGTLEGVAT